MKATKIDCELICDIVADITRYPRASIEADTNIAATGLDSLQRIALIEALEDLTGSTLDDQTVQQLLTATTIREIYGSMSERRG